MDKTNDVIEVTPETVAGGLLRKTAELKEASAEELTQSNWGLWYRIVRFYPNPSLIPSGEQLRCTAAMVDALAGPYEEAQESAKVAKLEEQIYELQKRCQELQNWNSQLDRANRVLRNSEKAVSLADLFEVSVETNVYSHSYVSGTVRGLAPADAVTAARKALAEYKAAR